MSALYGSLKALRELPTPNIVFWSPVVATCVSYSLACTSRMSFLDFVLLVLQNLFELPTKDNSLTCRVINILLLYVTMFQALENSALFFNSFNIFCPWYIIALILSSSFTSMFL